MISILISVHNGEKYIEKSLTSILDQTYVNYEMIIVNDASEDKTLNILQKYRKRYPDKITIIDNRENIGLTRSLIKAASEARGNFFARIDVGDIFHPNKLEKQIIFLKKNPDYGIIGCNYINVFISSNKKTRSNLPLSDKQIRETIIKKNPFAHSCVLMRRKTYYQAGGYNPQKVYGQDYELWFRILKVKKAANLSEYYCTRYMASDSISFTKQNEQMLQCIRTRWKYLNKLKINNYFYLLEPLFVVMVPKKFRKFIREHR